METKEKYYIIRCNNAGVFFGQIKSINEKTITMTNVRKLHYWEGAAAVEQLAMEGVKTPESCRFTMIVPEMEIEMYNQKIECTDEAVDSLKAVKIWKI